MSPRERLDMEDARTDCGDSGDDFTKLEFVEDGGFAGGIEADLY